MACLSLSTSPVCVDVGACVLLEETECDTTTNIAPYATAAVAGTMSSFVRA